jgi:GT2 family glycosyltransferase
MGSTCHRGGEYPDLRLGGGTRGTSFVDWSIVIPTIGRAELVAECVGSCRRFIPSGASVQFIVVDDGSSDSAALEALRRASKEHDFQLLFNRQNLGFSATVNRGMRRARGRYVVLCNNDIVFYRPWLEPLEQLFTNDPHVGIAGARLLYPDGTIQHAGMDKAGGSLNWYHTYGKLPGDHPPANATRYTWAVTGALFAVRRATLERLGGFSTAYATAYEDLDYCLYAWANGVRVAYSAEVSAYHLEGHTRGVTEEQKRQRPLWAERERAGRAYFEKKWAFLRHVEDFRALLSLVERSASELPMFAEAAV